VVEKISSSFFDYEGDVKLRPTTPATITSRQMILMMSRDSPNRIIPSTDTPTAPIPTQTAYAVPTGIVFKERDKVHMLTTKAATVRADGIGFAKPSVYLSPIAHPHSNKPAKAK
jgi:hypothetical protein